MGALWDPLKSWEKMERSSEWGMAMTREVGGETSGKKYSSTRGFFNVKAISSSAVKSKSVLPITKEKSH